MKPLVVVWVAQSQTQQSKLAHSCYLSLCDQFLDSAPLFTQHQRLYRVIRSLVACRPLLLYQHRSSYFLLYRTDQFYIWTWVRKLRVSPPDQLAVVVVSRHQALRRPTSSSLYRPDSIWTYLNKIGFVATSESAKIRLAELLVEHCLIAIA